VSKLEGRHINQLWPLGQDAELEQRGSVGQQKARCELGPCNLMIPLLIGPPTRTCFCGGVQTRQIGHSGSYTNLTTASLSGGLKNQRRLNIRTGRPLCSAFVERLRDVRAKR
jgi:hypothetical protein